MKVYEIGSEKLTVQKINNIIFNNIKITLSNSSKKKINESRKFLENQIEKNNNLIYGVNTGFGSLCNEKISKKDLEVLQLNLIKSHACGIGDYVPFEIVKIMMLLKIQSLSYGHSGIQLKTVNRLIDMFNNNIIPVVYQQGSLGASGDLAPLAHMSLPLIGEGEVNVLEENSKEKYKIKKSDKILKEMKWAPLKLSSKEGLALLNGTQFMSAYAVWVLIEANKMSYQADLISSISIDAFNCSLSPFNLLVHKVRPYKGQISTAKNILEILKGSEIQKRDKENVQDPYSFRCIPQVHGATKDVISYVESLLEIEVNSVTDNPLIFVKDETIISGGNFHGQPLALAMDYLSISLSELGSISERRVYQLISGSRELPSFLIKNSGLNSGMMIPQYSSASLVSQNKQLSTPSSVDSIPSSNGQEDHVSMGANSATKLYSISNNLKRILAIELLVCTQAISFRKFKSSEFIESLIKLFREEVSILENDRILHNDIMKSINFLEKMDVNEVF